MGLKAKLLAFSAAWAVIGAASAETVGWWHLDELADGVKATTGTAPFLNAVDPTKHAGLARATPLLNGDWRVSSGFMPQGAEAFPADGGYLDPVGGKKYANRLGVQFRPDLTTGSAGTQTRNTGPVVVIPYSAELCPHNCTWEMFFKFDPKGTTETEYIFFARKYVSDGTTNCGLRIWYNANADFVGVYFYERADGFSSDTKIVTDYNSCGINNGRWHHVAVTMDNDAHLAKLYVDYKYIGSKTLTIDCSLSTQDYSLGNSTSGWGSFDGCLDEFRISDRVLGPSEFLRGVADDPAPILPETAVYQRFTDPPDYFVVGSGTTNKSFLLFNEAPVASTLGQPKISYYGEGFFAQTDVPFANILTGAVESVSASNRSFVACRSNAESREDVPGGLPRSCPTWRFADSNASVSTNDLTAELFFRTTNVLYSTYFFTLGLPAYRVVANSSNGGININTTTVVTESIADGKWHHLALVVDGAAGTAQLYLDYKRRGDPVARDGLAAGKSYEEWIGVGCYGSSGIVTFFDVDFDEVRLTRERLDVRQFLHFATADDVILDKDFDQTKGLTSKSWANNVWGVSVSKTVVDGTSVSYDTTDKPGDLVADGLFAEKVANVSVERTSGGSLRTGASYYALSGESIAGLLSDSYTFEFEAAFPENAYSGYTDNAAYLAFHSAAKWMIRFVPPGNGESSTYLQFCQGYSPFASVAASKWADGNWHHYAFVYDKDRCELRAYFDHALVATKTGVTLSGAADETIYFGSGKWGATLGIHAWCVDNLRITKRALKPCEMKTSKFLTGNTLVWAPFDLGSSFISEIGLSAAFSGGAFAITRAGQLVDAAGEPIEGRGKNTGSLALASKAGAYGRLSLIEIPDFTAEFFVKDAASAAAGTDLVGLMGSDGSTPVWSVRKGADGNLHVMVTPQGGTLTDLGAFGAASSGWAHVAVVFEPAADQSETTVRVYTGYGLAGAEASFDGILGVGNLSTSSLKFGKFSGQIDELRIVRGTLSVADMLRAIKAGFALIIQ